MGSLESGTKRSSRRWIWIVAGVVVLVAGFPLWFLLFYGGAIKLHEWSAPVIALPPVHVRVVDGATGAPIPEAQVMRGFYREGSPQAFDGASPDGVAGSLVKGMTDAKGTAVLPGTESIARRGIPGLTGMSWVVFKPGWMPASGCYTEAPMREGGCSGFGGMDFSDPWFQLKLNRFKDQVGLDVRLIALPAQGAPSIRFDNSVQITTTPLVYSYTDGKKLEQDAWGVYFLRLNGLVQRRYLTKDELVQEAIAYLDGSRPLSDLVASQFLEVAGAPIIERPISRDHDRQIVRLRKAILDYCDQDPQDAFCQSHAVGVGYIREFFRIEANLAR